MSLDQREFRRVMGNFATGITILTTALGEELHGMTANAVCWVSLEPLLVLVCVNRQSRTHLILSQSEVFALNVLAGDQEHLSRLYADSATESDHMLAGLAHWRGVTGAPVLANCLAYVDCRVVESYPGGDHTIFVGAVEDARVLREDPPLVFFRGAYGLGEKRDR